MPRWASNPLRNVRIASPCGEDWEAMYGDDRVRFCGKCQLNVYNLSAMTRVEAERLIAGREGRLCARFFRRADGTVLTTDCPVGLAAVKRKIARAATAVFSFLFGVGAAASFHGLVDGPKAPTRRTEVMGAIALPEPVVTGEVVVGDLEPLPPAVQRRQRRSR